jgi:hypothetical protein
MPRSGPTEFGEVALDDPAERGDVAFAAPSGAPVVVQAHETAPFAALQDESRPPADRALAEGSVPPTQRRWLYAGASASLGDPPGDAGRFSEEDEDALGAMNLGWKKLARSCYEQAAAQGPGLHAAIALEVTVVGDAKVGGVVESAELLDGGAPDDPLVDCMRESLLSLPFPPPRGGSFVRFRFEEEFGSEAPSAIP